MQIPGMRVSQALIVLGAAALFGRGSALHAQDLAEPVRPNQLPKKAGRDFEDQLKHAIAEGGDIGEFEGQYENYKKLINAYMSRLGSFGNLSDQAADATEAAMNKLTDEVTSNTTNFEFARASSRALEAYKTGIKPVVDAMYDINRTTSLYLHLSGFHVIASKMELRFGACQEVLEDIVPKVGAEQEILRSAHPGFFDDVLKRLRLIEADMKSTFVTNFDKGYEVLVKHFKDSEANLPKKDRPKYVQLARPFYAEVGKVHSHLITATAKLCDGYAKAIGKFQKRTLVVRGAAGGTSAALSLAAVLLALGAPEL